MYRQITGEETPDEILRLVIDKFVNDPNTDRLKIKFVYHNNIPYLELHNSPRHVGEFLGQYRLDKMLLEAFPFCEGLLNQMDQLDVFRSLAIQDRDRVVRTMACVAMDTMITRLVLLQVALFEDNYRDTEFLTAGCLIHALVGAYADPNKQDIATVCNQLIRDLLDQRIENSAKTRRKLLVEALNILPFVQIPIKVGRPKGRKKSQKQRQEESVRFEKEVEAAVRKLYIAEGRLPTKIRVAEELRIGGEGTRGSAFYNKLQRYEIDYDAIEARVKLHG